jgi:hypothetical protein
MTWEDFWIGVGLIVLAVAGAVFVAGVFVFQAIYAVLVILAKNFKWLVLAGSAVAVAWIVTQ